MMVRSFPVIAMLAAATWLVARPPAPADPDWKHEFEMPFDFLHNQVVLRAMVNGEGPFDVILDSGTYASTIDLNVARRLKLPLGPATRETVGAGTRKVVGYQTTCREVRVGNLKVEDLRAAALDLSGISGAMGRPLGGVLGYSFLSARITQIDYFQRKIRFFTQSPFGSQPLPEVSARRAAFPMEFRGGSILPVLKECYINGQKIPVTIDTGSSVGLILFPAAIVHLGAKALAHNGTPLRPIGYAGKAELTRGWVRSFSLQHIDLGAVEVAYVLKGYGEVESLETRGGSIGNAVLQDFVVTLDYRNRVVVLEVVED